IIEYKKIYQSLEEFDLKYGQQIAHKVGQKVATAYKNHIKARFGNCLRRVINLIQGIKKGSDKEEYKKAKTEKDKLLFQHPKKVLQDPNLSAFHFLFQPYASTADMDKGVLYDVKKCPQNHFYMFFLIAQHLESELNGIMCFPLRTSF